VNESTQRGRVLLVDDDPAIRRDYAKVLRRLGFQVAVAGDGQDAIEQLPGGAFDLIISDLSMPRMDGLAFLRGVRQHDLDIPVVLMTGEPDLDSAVAAVEYGAFRYLTKPVDIDKLAEVVGRAVSLSRMAKLKREAIGLVGSEGRQLGDHASLDVRFANALEQLWMAYQPIVHWPSRSVFAYEALVRSSEPSLMSPLDLFDAAERLGRLRDLARRIRDRVARSAPQMPDGALLFVNLHPPDLDDPELFSGSSPLMALAPRVVLEITERASLDGVKGLSAKIGKLKESGFRIAIDDLGAGYAGLSSFSHLEPDFVKLDMSLIRGVDASPRKRSVVQAMARLCANELAIQVICEGVETPQERDVLALDSCDLMQGFLFARPARCFPLPSW
jgi:EAL domain-containing protein (putative c-di-GMP-specific phosphodiesterase class I)/ActR/RegA family two-component response regulator